MRVVDVIREKGFVRIAELLPAKAGPDELKSLLNQAKLLSGVSDFLQLADLKGPHYLNPAVTALELRRLLNVEVIATIPLRDYNRRGFIGMALSILSFGLENLFIVKGDPYQGEELAYGSNIYGFGEVSEAVRELSSLMKASGIKAALLAPLSLDKLSSERYREVIRERAEGGADAFLAQPFFGDVDRLLESLDIIRSIGVDAPVIVNIFPLKGLDDALNCEMRFGWTIPKKVKEALRGAGPGIALELARNWYSRLLENRGRIDGIHFSTRGDADLAIKVLTQSAR